MESVLLFNLVFFLANLSIGKGKSARRQDAAGGIQHMRSPSRDGNLSLCSPFLSFLVIFILIFAQN